MKIMVSACLAGENCKYNGGNNRNEKVLQLMEENDVITVCPEQIGGLPTPRVPSEIKNGVVTAKDGRIVDAEFRAGAAKCLEIARREQLDLIVLQSRSPSCGVKQRYDGTFSGALVDGAGITAQILMDYAEFRIRRTTGRNSLTRKLLNLTRIAAAGHSCSTVTRKLPARKVIVKTTTHSSEG